MLYTSKYLDINILSIICNIITIIWVEENWGPKRRAGRLLKESVETGKDQNEEQANERATEGNKGNIKGKGKGKEQRQGHNKKMKLDDITLKVASPISNSEIINKSDVDSGLQEVGVGSTWIISILTNSLESSICSELAF